MLNVLHMSTALDGGGVEMFLLNYYKNMDRKNIHFSIIVPGFKKGILEDQFLELGANVYHVSKLHDNFFKGIIEIYKIISKNRFDIIHCHGNKSSLLGIIFGFFSGVKVRIVHAHMTEETISHFKKIYKFFSQIIIKIFATNYFACGEEAGKYLFGKNNFIIINNAINLNKFIYNDENRIYYRTKLNLNDRLVIGCIARFAYQKNHNFMIDIFNELYKQDNRYRLVLIGEGELEDSIKEKCERLHISKYVTFLGNINNVNEVLSALDYGILTSFYEGLPVTLVEMQASGLKIFSSDTITEEVNITNAIKYISLTNGIKNWIEEIIKTKKNDKISRLIQNKNMRESKYDIFFQAKNLEKLYLKLCEEK